MKVLLARYDSYSDQGCRLLLSDTLEAKAAVVNNGKHSLQVYKAKRFGVQPVAVKVLREDSGKQIENFKREIEMLRNLRDNNIVLFLGACKKDGQLMLVTEYMPQGDLWNALNQSNAPKFQWYQR